MAAFVLIVGFALFNNNFSLIPPFAAAFDAQLDRELDQAIAWIAAHPRSQAPIRRSCTWSPISKR